MDIYERLDETDWSIVRWRTAGMSVSEMAKNLGVTEATVRRRLNAPGMAAVIADERTATIQPLVSGAIAEVYNSVKRLAEIRDSEGVSPAIQVKASTALLEWFQRVYEMAEMSPRLAALEAFAAEQRAIAQKAIDHAS